MVKRHVANALHVAKSMSRKGYANEGAVTEGEQAPFRPLTARSLGERWTPPEETIEENVGPKARELMENYPQKLKQAIKNAPNAAYEFVKYPGQLLYGEKEYNPEEAVEWSGSLATNMLGASSPFALAKMPTAAEAASTARTFAGSSGETVSGSGPIMRMGDQYVPHSNPKREQNLHDWFGESVVKNPDGSPKVVYHGSGADFSVFKPSATGEFGPGIYASSLADEATGYAWTHPEGTGPNVMPIHVRMEQPFVAKNPSDFWEAFGGKTDAEAMQNARKAGYDGVIITRPYTIYDSKRKQFYPTGQDHTHYVVFDPSQIKSATGNSGHFSLRDSDITKSEGGRTYTLADWHYGKPPKKLGTDKILASTCTKKAAGGTIVDKALMLMSSKAKRPRGRP